MAVSATQVERASGGKMNYIFPSAVLEQHIAVLGKTGRGKTSTAKLIIEQTVGDDPDARVCIMDPVKSDWWGLTASAGGLRGGLPFQILGGPHGHVPLHSGAGKAVGELVASGKLPLSIIDMRDFEPGGIYRFYVDFAAVLMRRMRGVVTLVMEEAHLFAPKERSGFSQENMAVHYAKNMATGGRSAGIRLILSTQRVQALHNALLGSCDTMIAHGFTAPADQEPVIKWFKANATKEQRETIEQSLSGLRKGEAYIFSGEAKLFERVQFQRISTYDNTATPDNSDRKVHVETAPIDRDGLRELLGSVVAEAEADDPKMLKKRIADLEEQLSDARVVDAEFVDEEAIKKEAYGRGRADGLEQMRVAAGEVIAKYGVEYARCLDAFRTAIARTDFDPPQLPALPDPPERMFAEVLPRLGPRKDPVHARQVIEVKSPKPMTIGGEPMKPVVRAILTVMAQHPDGLSKGQILVHANYRSSGDTSAAFADLTRRGWITSNFGSGVAITSLGVEALGPYDALPTGRELRKKLLAGDKLSRVEKAILECLFSHHPQSVSKGDILREANYKSSGDTSAAFAKLTKLGYVNKAAGGHLVAGRDLFT